jgi:GMP synthase (glutamine-hydrolysing)
MAMEGTVLVIKHVEQEGPGRLGDMFSSDGWDVKIVELGRGESLPPTLDGVAALIILGGPMNVYEESTYAFLKQEDRLITRALVDEVPLLGICLGAQLLSKTCGGIVTKSPAREVGWYHVDLTEAGKKDSLLQGLPGMIDVFQWHEDTFEVPEGGVLLAQGKKCRNQAFRMGNCAYGLQFHLEVTPEMVEQWMEGEAKKMHIEKILSDTKKVKERFQEQAGLFMDNFRRMVESSFRVKRVMKMFVEEEKKAGKKRAALWWNMKEHTLVAAQ